MSVIHNDLLLSGDDGYNLTRSLRFRSSASSYLNRTPASAGNRQTFTYSLWVKRGSVSGVQTILSVGVSTSSNPRVDVQFDGNNNLQIDMNSSGSAWDCLVITNQVFRDPSAWYHLVIAVDTTQATSSNRVKLYVNGSQVTSFSSSTYPSQNTNMPVNNTLPHGIGNYIVGSNQYFDGYITEFNFIDGQALTPSSFGETSSTTGVWQPKKYAGTYGTNGFYLPFTDNSALTSGSNAGLGKDFSGNGNYWNTNNISITSGSTYDSMTDVPTNTSATAANFPTMNPLIKPYGTLTPSEANLKVTVSSAWSLVGATNTLPLTGKYYWEFTKISGAFFIGLYKADLNQSAVDQQDNPNGTIWYYDQGNKLINGATTAYGATYAANDVIGVAVDMDAQSVTFYKNNVSQGAISFPSNMQGVPLLPAASLYAAVMIANFGQRPFAYTPPTGYVALNTYNLPTPTIGATASSQANKYFDVKLYTGTGSAQSITGLNFQPDFVWIKSRSNAGDHGLVDAVRGRSKVVYSDLTDAEGTSSATEDVTAFNSDGFSLGTSARFTSNNNGWTFASWNWKANGSGSSNTAGSITSTVSANTTSGFSVVTYTGNGSGGATIGHGLGVAPSMVIVKRRDAADDWSCYHVSLGGTKYIDLNNTAAAGTSIVVWNNTNPSSTVVTLGTSNRVNGSGATYVAYCFSAVAGYSAFGSYTGNGSSDGTFVATGFTPRFVMIKRTDASGYGWYMRDTARDTYNVGQYYLDASSSSAEGSGGVAYIDFLSNGFKLRNTTSSDGINASGGSYIYMAFASVPQKFSLGR